MFKNFDDSRNSDLLMLRCIHFMFNSLPKFISFINFICKLFPKFFPGTACRNGMDSTQYKTERKVLEPDP